MKLLRKQRGFSLIEVLVSLVIMSVGMLGVAGMQVISLQQNRSSMLRGEALQLGNDIMDRMRANPVQDYAGEDFDDDPPTSANCVSNVCTAAQMKDFDIAQWKCSINSTKSDGSTYPICTTLGIFGSLPTGQGAIVDNDDDTLCAVAAGETCAVIRWVDNRDGTTSQISLRTRTD